MRRLQLGLTQEQLAERISGDGEFVRQSEISRIESGAVSLPRRGRLERLALALEIPVGELLARSGWSDAEHFFSSTSSAVERPLVETVQSDTAVDSADGAEPDHALRDTRSAAELHLARTETATPIAPTDRIDIYPRLQSRRGEIRSQREALGRALGTLEGETQRLLRNRRTAQEIEARFRNRESRDNV